MSKRDVRVGMPFHVDVAVGECPHVHRGFGHLVVAPRGVAEHVANREEREDLAVLRSSF